MDLSTGRGTKQNLFFWEMMTNNNSLRLVGDIKSLMDGYRFEIAPS
jgi:hypothetical protein